MTYERVMFQLRDILEDKKKYMDKEDPEDVISEDVEALEQAMKMLRDAENVIYRLNSKDEVIKLQEELIENYKDHVKILNERIDILKERIDEQGK